tara:strand:- start:876 stop:2777 length:1902 start_codon:yes stop_codon:yes gene_type:complete
MISYFKYTTGNAFTLSGANYTGLLNIVDGVAYTGKSLTTSSKVLSSSNTFLSNCFLNKFEFDRTTAPIDTSVIKRPSISPRNIIDQTFVDTNLQCLNLNNLHLYALNIVANPNILDFANTVTNGDSYFLGASSSSTDLRNDDLSLAKDANFPIQIDPFSTVDKIPGVDVLDDTLDSTLFVYDDESYFYFITTATNSYTFSGSFVHNGGLVRLYDDPFKGNSKFTYDNNTDILYSLDGIDLNLYDNSFINPCKVFKLVDKVTLPTAPLDDVVEIGNNLLGFRARYDASAPSGTRGISIQLHDKNSFKFIAAIRSRMQAETILAFDIRDTDDSILVLTSRQGGENTGKYFLYHIDVDTLGEEDSITLGDNHNPKTIFRYQPETEYNVREEIQIYFSGSDSNIFTLNDNGAISTRFISDPLKPSGIPATDNLLYLKDMLFDDTRERFNLIEKKFNSNLLRSNFFNNINLLVTKNNSNLFYLLHNIGRIYLFRDSSLQYKNYIPLDLANLYEKITSCESSLGISLNSELQNIIKDTINIYLNASVIPIQELVDGIPVLRKYISYEGMKINFRDFEFHENEEVTYDSISRVFNEIYELQQAVINTMASGEIIDEIGQNDLALSRSNKGSVRENGGLIY